MEPAVAMLEVARHRPDAHLVEWVAGDARALTVSGADLVVLVSHVVQLVVDDDELSATFMAAWRALAPHGRLAFDSRPPRMVRNLGFAPRSVALADGTSVEHGCELVGTDGDVAHYRLSYRFPATGETLTSDTVLRFRSLDRLTRLLQRAADADLVVEAWGDVDRRPADATTSEQLVTARRA